MFPKSLNEFSRQVVEIMPLFVREFAKREDHDLMRGKISCPQMVTLDCVSRKKRVTTTDIAKILSIKTSSASVLVDRLIRQRLLQRKHDDKDRRVIWISPTPKGRKVVAQIIRQKRQSIKAIFGFLTKKERDQYLSVLLKVKAHLEKKSDE